MNFICGHIITDDELKVLRAALDYSRVFVKKYVLDKGHDNSPHQLVYTKILESIEILKVDTGA
jgi:hypothetical protein